MGLSHPNTRQAKQTNSFDRVGKRNINKKQYKKKTMAYKNYPENILQHKQSSVSMKLPP